MIVIVIKPANFCHAAFSCMGGVGAGIELIDKGRHDGITVTHAGKGCKECFFKDAVAAVFLIHTYRAVLV